MANPRSNKAAKEERERERKHQQELDSTTSPLASFASPAATTTGTDSRRESLDLDLDQLNLGSCHPSASTVIEEAILKENILAGKKVLVIDDNAFQRGIILGILKTKGLDIGEETGNMFDTKPFFGHQAAEMLLEKLQEYDVIICDFDMPGKQPGTFFNGNETVREIRDKGYKGVIIGCSALKPGKEDAEIARKTEAFISAGADGFFVKPLPIREVIPFLERTTCSLEQWNKMFLDECTEELSRTPATELTAVDLSRFASTGRNGR